MKYYRVDIILAIVVGVLLSWFLGPGILPYYLLLVVIEVTLSGDNVVVNVILLRLLSRRWVVAFMTVGVVIAAGFMRFLFPILIVALAGHMGFVDALRMAVYDHLAYRRYVDSAHSEIAVFGGVYLLMIAGTFFVAENTERYWITCIERPIAIAGRRFEYLMPVIAATIVLVLSAFVPGRFQYPILLAGFISQTSYMAIKSLSRLATNSERASLMGKTLKRTGWAALGVFLALEAQDAAFSFDGVSGALAITSDPILIAASLGVGAVFVRSATRHLMETGNFVKLQFMGHGAFYAIFSLGVAQIVSLFADIPSFIPGGISAGFIVTAILYSIFVRKKRADVGEELLPVGSA